MENRSANSATFRTAGGLEIFHYDAEETKFVYKEIFEDRVYFRHGITLSKGDCVWDIGANIGLFTLFVQETFEDIQVHAFEPSPQIFEILTANTARYGRQVIAHRCGIAAQEREASFTFYPRYSIMSGFRAQSDQDSRTLRSGVLNRWRQRYPNHPDPEQRFLDSIVDSALGEKREYTCTLRSVSELIQETHTTRIDLLKIDAEGSEADILAGIRDEHWPLIRQIVLEIHDGDGRLGAPIIRILGDRGFETVVEQEAGLSGSGVVNCYALRPATAHQPSA